VRYDLRTGREVAGSLVGRALARANGGDLVLEGSAEDGGAAFRLALPGESPTEG
jgi:hypothetical protein